MSAISAFFIRLALPFIFLSVTLYGIIRLIGMSICEFYKALLDPHKYRLSVKSNTQPLPTTAFTFPPLPYKQHRLDGISKSKLKW